MGHLTEKYRKELIARIRAVVVKTCNQKTWSRPCPGGCVYDIVEDITLADILATFRDIPEKHGGICVDNDGLMMRSVPYVQGNGPHTFVYDAAATGFAIWNIYADSLEKQNDGCIGFIASNLL